MLFETTNLWYWITPKRLPGRATSLVLTPWRKLFTQIDLAIGKCLKYRWIVKDWTSIYNRKRQVVTISRQVVVPFTAIAISICNAADAENVVKGSWFYEFE